MLSDYNLIYKIKNNNSSDSVIELANRHEGLIIKEFAKYCCNTGLKIEEVSEDRYFIVNKAAQAYDESRGAKFSTYLCNLARFHVLSLIKQYNKHELVDNLEPKELNQLIDSKFRATDSAISNNLDFKNFVEKEMRGESEKVQKIVRLKFLNDEEYTLKEIGDKVGLTPERIRQIIEQFSGKLRKKIKTEI